MYSGRLKDGSALPLMSVVVATIAAMSLLVTAAEHIPLMLQWMAHPREVVDSLAMPTWAQMGPVVWSALMSTDLVLLIEVPPPLPPSQPPLMFTLPSLRSLISVGFSMEHYSPHISFIGYEGSADRVG